MPTTATAAHPLFQKNNTGPLDFLFLNVTTFNYKKMSFYCFSADDISASPWASNAPDAVQQILVHNRFRNRLSWWWRCIMIASQNVLVSESTLRYFVHACRMFVSLLRMLNDVSSILPYTEKYISNQKTDNLHRLLVREWKQYSVLLWDETHRCAFSGTKTNGAIKSIF